MGVRAGNITIINNRGCGRFNDVGALVVREHKDFRFFIVGDREFDIEFSNGGIFRIVRCDGMNHRRKVVAFIFSIVHNGDGDYLRRCPVRGCKGERIGAVGYIRGISQRDGNRIGRLLGQGNDVSCELTTVGMVIGNLVAIA